MSSGRVRKAAGERAAAGVCRGSREPKTARQPDWQSQEKINEIIQSYFTSTFILFKKERKEKNGRDSQNCPKSHCNALLKLFIPK